MKKLISILLILVAIALCLVSCKNKTGSENNITGNGGNGDIENPEIVQPEWVAPTPSSGFVYTLLDDGTYEISDIGSCSDVDIVIPTEYQGKKISSIGVEAFESSQQIKSVTFLGGINSIGSLAFYNCQALEKVTVVNISDWFKITFEDEEANPLSYARKLFVKSERYNELIVPEGITSIPDYAFYNAEIRTATIPEGVLEIGVFAFRQSDIETLVIPSSVTAIWDWAFANCDKLTTIKFHDECKVESLYFTFEGCDSLTEVKIAGNVGILYGTFGGCNNLSSVEFKENSVCENISYGAFSECAIEYIRIPESVQSISFGAFIECANLTSVYFEDPFNWYIDNGSDELLDSNTVQNSSKMADYFTNNAFDYHDIKKRI